MRRVRVRITARRTTSSAPGLGIRRVVQTEVHIPPTYPLEVGCLTHRQTGIDYSSLWVYRHLLGVLVCNSRKEYFRSECSKCPVIYICTSSLDKKGTVLLGSPSPNRRKSSNSSDEVKPPPEFIPFPYEKLCPKLRELLAANSEEITLDRDDLVRFCIRQQLFFFNRTTQQRNLIFE